jgi:hypothetical protein
MMEGWKIGRVEQWADFLYFITLPTFQSSILPTFQPSRTVRAV